MKIPRPWLQVTEDPDFGRIEGTALLQGIPAFRDFTIPDPLYFVIQFQALNS